MVGTNPFRLKKPCANCPFRSDEGAIHLAPGRLGEIAREITEGEGKTFFCHKTLSGTHTEDDDGVEISYKRGEKDSLCAGAVIFQLKYGRLPIGARLGFMSKDYDYESMMAQFPNVVEPDDLLADREPGRYWLKDEGKWIVGEWDGYCWDDGTRLGLTDSDYEEIGERILDPDEARRQRCEARSS